MNLRRAASCYLGWISRLQHKEELPRRSLDVSLSWEDAVRAWEGEGGWSCLVKYQRGDLHRENSGDLLRVSLESLLVLTPCERTAPDQGGAVQRAHARLPRWCLWWRAPLLVQEMSETWVQSLRREDPVRGGHGNSLPYSCLESSMDRGAWWATAIASQGVGHN